MEIVCRYRLSIASDYFVFIKEVMDMMSAISFMSRGKIVRGFEHRGEHLTNAPAIVMCHGFTGDCSEHKLFDDFADIAAACGYYVIRFNCVGSGTSEGEFSEYTYLDGWKEDIIAAMDYASSVKDVDRNRIFTLGISMGAAATLLASVDSRVIGSVGWAPVVFPERTFKKIVGDSKWQELDGTGPVKCEYAGNGFEIRNIFKRSAVDADIIGTMRQTGKHVYLRFGTADEVIDLEMSEQVESECLPNVTVNVVEGEDHGCMTFERNNILSTLEFMKNVN